ncbi:MAG: polyphenol oxidase family protein [Minisyncoccia bacterium]
MIEKGFREKFENKREKERREQIKEGIWFPKIFKDFPVICAASTKEFPGFIYLRNPKRFEEEMNIKKAKAARNLILFLRKLNPNLNPKFIAYPELAHTTNIKIIREEDIEKIKEKIKIENTDGLITAINNLPLIILGADCPSIGVYDKENNVIGVFHSGWKGTAGNIVGNGLEILKKEFNSNSKNIYVVVGPGISEDYEVGEDVYLKFLNSGIFSKNELRKIFKEKKDKYNLDLFKAINFELLKTGIPEKQIEITSLRTDRDNDLFPSYRKEGKEADRFAFLLALNL